MKKSATSPLVANHFSVSITQPSPRRRAVPRTPAGSEPASASVIA